MPLSLIKRPGRPSFYIRGTHLGVRIYQSAGTDSPRLAEALRADIILQIEREALGLAAKDTSQTDAITFLDAVEIYLDAGGEGRFLPPLIDHFEATHLADITQDVADGAAAEIYPTAKIQTRRRQFYTPLIALRNQAAQRKGLALPPLQKPRVPRHETRPRPAPDPNWYAAVLPHCRPQLAALIVYLYTTGDRIGSAIALDWAAVDLSRGEVALATSKNGDPALIELPPAAIAALANIPADHSRRRRGRVFGYRSRSNVARDVRIACAKAKQPYFSSHEFGRHAMARHTLAEGFTVKHVQELGRWRSAQHVLKTYGHLERQGLNKTRAAVSQHLSEMPETSAKSVPKS